MPIVRSDESNAVYSLVDGPSRPATDNNVTASAREVEVIEGLRAHIRRIEGTSDFAASTPAPCIERWGLGIPVIDELLGPIGLDAGGVHEIRSDTLGEGMGAAAATAARRAFALLLGVRRIASQPRPGPALWCLPMAVAHESGALYSRGLAALGLDPDRLIIVTPRKAQDVLWVIEEAVKADCLSLVIGEVGAVGVTAARRLSLAAAEARRPCILVSPAGRTPATATATRWRVAPRRSTGDPLDPLAPGAPAFAIALERCRARPLVAGTIDFAVEWSDAARCFRMAAAVSDRTPASGAASGSWPDAEGIRRTA
ncbi:MAG: hypothetical protein ABL904_26855 [Hyphomicrobiaceae bacterium]